MKTLLWFRQDLRLADNSALSWAVESGEILPIFILDTTGPSEATLGGASKWWLRQSLIELNRQLQGHLKVYSGDPKLLIPELVERYAISQVVWNRCYQDWEIQRDTLLKQQLLSAEIIVKSFNGSLLWEPMAINKPNGEPYKVFTPFYRRGCLQAKAPRYPLVSPKQITFTACGESEAEIDDLQLLPDIPWYQEMAQTWQPGEVGAKQRLQQFVQYAVDKYRQQRDLPAVAGTSMLSPHLHWGEISPNQIWYAVLEQHGGMDKADIDTFLSELGWREFSYYSLYQHPNQCTENILTRFNAFPWRRDNAALTRWQKGKTGIPIVDAGMRQLWQTGYMHNRVRMVVGSFLVKNLLIHWREGERWFWDCLVDADMASNSASWQWIAGCGADAAPYFRIFNPILQGEKFDKDGEYVRTYCPELAKLPNKYIHKPWVAPQSVLQDAGISLGDNYPAPIVDLKQSRQAALEAFKRLKN